jgi:hypothetical protein
MSKDNLRIQSEVMAIAIGINEAHDSALAIQNCGNSTNVFLGLSLTNKPNILADMLASGKCDPKNLAKYLDDLSQDLLHISNNISSLQQYLYESTR